MSYSDVTGIITQAGSDSSAVSVIIEGAPKEFSFRKAIFYSFGVKCEGRMDNILEDGMEVNLCYNHPSHQTTPCIIAVWIGDRPDTFEEDRALEAVYNKNGYVKYLNGDRILVECDDLGHNVSVNKQIVYLNGHPFCEEIGATVRTGDNITFDAIPYEEQGSDDGNAKAAYYATCAWIGVKEPRMVDRFCFRLNENNIPGECISKDHQGTVVVIPNDAVALVEVKLKNALVKALLFRNSFVDYCERIQDVVTVGDSLSLKLGTANIFLGREQWFITQAWKNCHEIGIGDKAAIYRKAGNSVKSKSETMENVPQTNLVEVVSHEKKTGFETSFRSFELKDNANKSFQPAALNETITRKVSETSKKTLEFCPLSKVLYSEPPLSGTISRLSTNAACITYNQLKIFVDRGDVYIDGALCSAEQFRELISSGEQVVNFEAILRRNSEKKEIKMTHHATRVWVGKKPTLQAISSAIAPTKLSLLKQKKRIFAGVVSKFCLPKVALVYVEEKCTTVCLYSPQKKFISDLVNLNDYVRFKLQPIPAFAKALCTCTFKIDAIAPKPFDRLSPSQKLLFSKKAKAYDSTTPTNPSNDPAEKQSLPVLKSDAQGDNITNTNEILCSQDTFLQKAWIPFRRAGIISEIRSRLINAEGTVTVLQEGCSIIVQHTIGVSPLIHKPIIYGANENLPLGSESINRFDGCTIRFDAEVHGYPKERECIFVKTMWTSDRSRPAAGLCRSLTSKLSYKGSVNFLPTELYNGTIMSIPFHNSAVAVVNEVPILVPIESLVTLEKYNLSYTCINELLSEGEKVSMKIEQESVLGVEGLKYFKAIKCGRVIDSSPKPESGSQIETSNEGHPVSWQSVWGSGEYFGEGLVGWNGNRFFVTFSSSKYGKLNLSLEGPGVWFFIDGVLTRPQSVPSIKGRKVSFHASYSHEQEMKDPSTHGFSVACAWIGNEPSPLIVLKDQLVWCEDIPFPFHPNWMYDVVVKDFPLPTHMVCGFGSVLNVLVPLSRIEKEEKFIGVEESFFARGDLVSVRIQKVSFESCLYAVSNLISEQAKFYNVMSLFNGKCDREGGNLNIIVNPDIRVNLEICHLYNLLKEICTQHGENTNVKVEIMSPTCSRFYVTVGTCSKTNKSPYRMLRLLFQ